MTRSTGAPGRRRARSAFTRKLGIRFRNRSFLETALTHRSYAYEQDGLETNERLEFLGDAILNLCITDLIYAKFPDYFEGDLAKLRASLVSEPALAEIAQELDLGPQVLLGRGEELSGGREKPSILSDTLEAVIGAVYQDGGIRGVRKLVRNLFGSRIDAAEGQDVPKDSKTRLQEIVTRRWGILPRYRTVGHGPDHEKRFKAEVFVKDKLRGRGEGRSKKEAEQAAAAEAVETFDEVQHERSEAAGA